MRIDPIEPNMSLSFLQWREWIKEQARKCSVLVYSDKKQHMDSMRSVTFTKQK